MRTLFYEFPEDTHAWEVHDEYMYGDKVLIAPIRKPVQKSAWFTCREMAHSGKRAKQKKEYSGGQWICVPVTLESMPVFIKK